MNKNKSFPKKKVAVSAGVLEAEKPTEISVVEPQQETRTSIKHSFGRKKDGPTVYELLSSSVDPKTKKNRFALVYMIKAEDIIYDPIKQVNRKIRYIPGEQSIFEDEQKKDAKVRTPITFNEGFLIVGKQNPTLKKFMDHHNQNANNPNRITGVSSVFQEKDPTKQAKIDIKKSNAEVDAMSLALKMPMDKLIGYAKVLGVNVDKSTDEIRYDMKIKAQKNPVAFVKGLDDPLTGITETILAAKEYRIIDVHTNKICWVMGTERPLIVHVPIGKKAIEYFADYCKAGEGEKVFKEIKRQISNHN